jgi:hypothetical protein
MIQLAPATVCRHSTLETNSLSCGAVVGRLGRYRSDKAACPMRSAAQVLISWSHPGRLRSEAAFATLAGAAPIPASSGLTNRHRLNRGGDRQLNRALHTIVLTRSRTDPATRAYITRRLAEGKTARETKRCLKRIIARQIFRLLQHQSAAESVPKPLDAT